MTEQPAGEHHTGTLNLTGEGNAPQAVSDDLVRLASFAIAEHRTLGWSDLPDAVQAVEAASYAKAMRATLEAAYPAIRRQVAEEIAVAIEGCVTDLDQWPGEFYQDAAAKAREIGDRA